MSEAYTGEKAASYYANERRDIIDALPRPLGRVLDVGCGAGGLAHGLRQAGATHLSGVESVASAAAAARERYDEVIEAPIEEALARLEGPFDTVLCLDVLEHLVDPAAVVEGLRAVTGPGARLQVSLPNARHVGLVYDLLVRGTFGYTNWGHRDSTHLRWFTKSDITELLESRGWHVRGISHPELARTKRLDRLTRGWSTNFLVGQWYVLAERDEQP
jgi:2-polyprenyl-3-methyl-5-hydroxy-6-metoxy-1,4-benzoquinol methylase